MARPVEYYDPKYDRVVNESVPKEQYELLHKQAWFHKTYNQFLSENFLTTDHKKIKEETKSESGIR